MADLPCNPNIGGTGKGHLVREVDALGGEMGINIDKTFIQSRMLNTSKGPAVHSLRVQADKKMYHTEMKKVLEEQVNLEFVEGEAVELHIENGAIKAVETRAGALYETKVRIIATGTYLRGEILMGELRYESGPHGMKSSKKFGEALDRLGSVFSVLKQEHQPESTGTACIYSKMEIQEGIKGRSCLFLYEYR